MLERAAQPSDGFFFCKYWNRCKTIGVVDDEKCGSCIKMDTNRNAVENDFDI